MIGDSRPQSAHRIKTYWFFWKKNENNQSFNYLLLLRLQTLALVRMYKSACTFTYWYIYIYTQQSNSDALNNTWSNCSFQYLHVMVFKAAVKKFIIDTIESLALCFFRYIASALRVENRNRRSYRTKWERRSKVKLYDWRSMISFYHVVTYKRRVRLLLLLPTESSSRRKPLLP